MNALIPTAGDGLSMTSLEISELVNSNHADVRRSMERLAERGVISLPPLAEVKIQRERRAETVKVFRFTGERGKRDSIIVVAQLCPEFTARLVDRWQMLEQQVSFAGLPDFTNPAIAARAWADQVEQKQIAESERDRAIATKAEIGSRREATAMATASRCARKAAVLEAELDKSMQYASVKRMEATHKGKKFDWRKLKKASADLSLPPRDTFDANYGTVKSYHIDVWMDAYGVSIVPPARLTNGSAPAMAVAEARMQNHH